MENEAADAVAPRLPFRPPKQGRSQETLSRIADAALALMEERGVEGATISAIVARAGASVGSFYARFPGKEELIRFLRARVWTEARTQWDAALEAQAWEGLSVGQVVEGVVGLLLRSYRADFQRRKVLGREGGWDAEGADLLLAFHEHVLETVTPLLLARREEILHSDPAGAVGIGYRFVAGAIREFLELEEARELSGREVTGLPRPQEVGPVLARIWMGTLAPEAGNRGEEDEGAVDFFDPWG
jgi:AcrR family transcriptional regulator